jgi:hypothetical protein
MVSVFPCNPALIFRVVMILFGKITPLSNSNFPYTAPSLSVCKLLLILAIYLSFFPCAWKPLKLHFKSKKAIFMHKIHNIAVPESIYNYIFHCVPQ